MYLVNYEKQTTSKSCKTEPTIWSRDAGQRIPCFEKMLDIKDIRCKRRLGISWSMTTMLREVIVVIGGMRPRSMPLAVLTMKNELHGFCFYAHTWFFSYSNNALLGGPSGRRSSAIAQICRHVDNFVRVLRNTLT